MANNYLFYVHPSTILRSDFDYASSDQFGKLKSGDTLWMVTLDSERLLLRGRLRVAEVVARREAQRRVGRTDLWEARHYALTQHPEPCRKVNVSRLARRLRFHGGKDRLPSRFTGQHLQTMRRLTDDSATLLEAAWSSRRNPAWHRDELILALDLYFRLGKRIPDKSESAVVEVSDLLHALPLHANRPDAARFRNVNGVVLKLANFRSLDQPGRGMSRIGKLDREVWEEFAEDRETLRQEVSRVRQHREIADDRPSDREPRTRRASELADVQGTLSYVLNRQTRVVNQRHAQYQVRLRDYLALKGVEAELELDFIDVRFRVDGELFIGEVKVTSSLTPEEAFRTALGQLLDYGATRVNEPHALVMLLDHTPDRKRLDLAKRLGVTVVVETNRSYSVQAGPARTPLRRVFSG